MAADIPDWRSSANYEHVEKLTASDLAWEWLRRNENYLRDFELLSHAETEKEKLTETIRQQWGLRFRH
ncbi:hypothetical protein GCM10011491_45100 [Brucella endophytica]|uniref:Transcriptional regulator-like domain-containing protein n=1 Tax=Brucella endophytica TaxID=1963359 RepID=A0A916SSY0_9HYPH|nr:DUF6499 domain-containing protein [Brucella endophytica]GGB12217.1 hypothetical protein GCM10011491_45100 [Brucella endophytica]